MSNSTQTPSATTVQSSTDEFIQLRGAQERIRNAYFDADDGGLYALNAVPGSGKSVVTRDIAAREILRRFSAGDPAPDRSMTVVSFNADEAEKLVLKITTRLRELVEHDAMPTATDITDEELSHLIHRVRQADSIGTVDSILRDILSDIAAEVGFETVPTVGNELRLARIHADTYETITEEPANESALNTVRAAYPPDTYDDGPADLLRRALQICRTRRLSTDEFIATTRETVAAVYEEGRTDSFDDIATALERCLDQETATSICTDLDGQAKDDLVEADQQLHDQWLDVIDAFGQLLDAYREEYRRRIRADGVISHTDAAYLVAEYLQGALSDHELTEITPDKRQRVLDRHRTRFDSLIIDEAQDISTIQHEALTPLVTEHSRVFLAGDIRQSIYVWRDAQPSLFADAVDNGQYLGIDWEPHVTETTKTTYRAVPDIAHAVDAITNPILCDPDRGNLADFDLDVPALQPARDGADEPRIHLAAFHTNATPGSRPYVAGGDGSSTGEAEQLARFIAHGLADGTLDTPATTDTDESPTVTVLFRWRTHMDAYAEAFAAEGLTVANATDYLFDAPAVQIVLNVVEWLVDPADRERLQTLVSDSTLDLASLDPAFDAHEWVLDAVLDADPPDLSDEQARLLERLQALRDNADAHRARSAPKVIGTIIDTLALRADPLGLCDGDDRDRYTQTGQSASDRSREDVQRVANLDTLEQFVRDWDDGDEFGLAELPELLSPLREAPYRGPTQPLAEPAEHDVVFRTIHQAKGDEADIVALADIGFPLHKHGPTTQRLIASPGMIGLAPPADMATPDVDTLGIFRGLFNPDPDENGRLGSPRYPRAVGLRWTTEYWLDETTRAAETDAGAGLVGHDHLQQAVATTRAEAWRILYVALTRASDHLVLPLPKDLSTDDQPRDRWLDPIRDGVDYDDSLSHGTYSLSVQTAGKTRSVTIGVNDAELFAHGSDRRRASIDAAPHTLTTEVDDEKLPQLVPRFLRPSTIYPLTEAQSKYILAHLRNEPLHTESASVDPSLPFTFEVFDTEGVGQFVHEVVTSAIDRDLSQQAMDMASAEFSAIVEQALDHHGPPASKSEREGLLTFLTETIVPDILDSQLWEDIQAATDVFTEVPVRDEYTHDDCTVEVEGQADIVLKFSDGAWQVADLKVALSEANAETRERYKLQTAVYADLLETTTQGDVESVVETVGVTTERFASSELVPNINELVISI